MRRFGGAADEPGAAVADGAERERHGVRVRPRGRVIGLAVAIVAVTVTATAYALTHGAPAGRPAAASAQHAALTPAVQGSWQQAGRVLTFQPAVPFSPLSRITLRIPAGQAGVRAAGGGLLARPVVAGFRTRAWSTRRLSELLAHLGYLPLSWTPLGGGAGRPTGGGQPATASAAGPGLAAQIAAAYSPPPGIFRWHHGYPASLHRQWHASRLNVLLKGAVMAFQARRGMTMTGTASLSLWRALFRAAGHGRANRVGYSYAVASKGSPETLTIWHDGHVVLRSDTNTGIPV